MKAFSMKRFTALMLCLLMLIGCLPVNVLAADDSEVTAQAEDTIYVLAGGDFQEAGDHANSAANVTNILKQINQKYTTMDGFLFIGDYDCETHNDVTETANGITALMDAVDNVYTNITDANSVLAQGNHDYMDSRIDATGGHDFEGYSTYVLNEDDYPNGGGSQSGVQTLANNLKIWLNNKIGEGYSAPIFIVSHLPLAFTPRTVTQGDAKYAKYIFDVLNDAGANGLNIIFLHGHDHAYGPDNYMGGEAIYLPKGDKINIAESESTSKWTEETLNFTYMNAGYTGYYSGPYTYDTTAGTDKLTMTVFAITDNEVTVERYSEKGLYNLKSAGYDGSYSDTSVTATSLSLTLNSTVYASPQTIALTNASSGSSNDEGTIGEYVGVSSLVEDVTTSGGKWVTITAATNGTEGSDPTYQYVLDTDGIDYGSDNKYLIVAQDAAYLLDAGSGVAVTLSSDGKTATTSTTNYEYYFTTGGLITRDGTNTLYQQNWVIHVGNVSDSNLNGFTNLGNGYYRIYDTVGEARSLYWDGDSWTVTSSDHTDSKYSVRLYKFDQTIPGSDATPGSNGLYGYLDGELRYEVASGTSAADALAAVKAGIVVKYSYYEDYSNAGEYADDGDGMTWTLDSAYDGTTSGDYAVTVVCNETVLGTASVVVPATTTYYIAEGDGLYTVAMNTSADDALAKVKAGITVSFATDANGTNKTTIDDSRVTWNWVDKYDGTNYGPYTVEILYNGTSLGTVEVKVNVQYDTEIAEGWTFIENTEGGYKYVLDTDGIDYNTSSTSSNNRYIIVAADKAIALSSTPTSTVEVIISGDGNTAIVSRRENEYHFYLRNRSSYNRSSYYICNGSGQYLYHGNTVFSLYSSRSRRAWTSFTHNGNGVYTLLGTDNNGDWQMYYSNSNSQFRVADGSGTVRLYKYEGEAEAANVYAQIQGNTVYTVNQGKSATSALAKVKAGITGYISNNADGSNATELDDSKLTWTWKNKYDGNTPGSYWVEISYNGYNGKVLGTVEVKVEPGIVNNYPEYPNEGSVKVSKTGTGIDFQSSGIAQVEISASGVPVKKGADVIVMLDTSSSMTSHTITGSSKTRAEVLEESLEDLIAQFKTPGADSELLDIRVAIADFNGFYGENQSASGTAYDRDAADMMSDDIYYNAASEAQVYTGDGTLGAGAFIDAADLANSYTLNYTSGTNYDYAFDAVYQMGTAIKEANGSEDRDLYVIFMSDGAAMQWNYYHSQGASSLWNNWITGAWDTDDLTTTNLNCTTHAYYYDEVDHDGDGMANEHRMANAIKGDPDEEYEVIRKTNTLGTATGETNMYMVPGLGATMFAISFDAQTDTNVTEESMDKSIETLASEQTGTTQYYYKVTTADELSSAFDAIGSEIAYAAYNARFVDQMGDDYNLQMKTSTYTVVDGDTTTTKPLAPVIEILTYDIYTRQDYLDCTITSDKIGDRKGTSTAIETVTFNEDGTEAYSTLNSTGPNGETITAGSNILINGVIYANTFWYNTTSESVTITGVDIPTDTNTDNTTTGSTNILPAETFYWKLGTVQTSELAMRYYVYLDGSMEGTREGGSYPTNEYATLYYDNYLENPCYKDTVSPVMAWKEANVSYAFYLVDENGKIIVNQTTGQTGSFANKIAVTNPVVYETVLLNSDEEVSSIDIASLGVLPEGYTLYDYDGINGATYTVTINSNTTGNWSITTVKDVYTTYVTQYDPENAAAYSNDLNNSTVGDDYTHTVVWFAVLWKVQALPDVVVIDYGLPVDISVLVNDMFGENGKLAGVGAYSDSLNLDGHDPVMAPGFGNSYTGSYGTVTTDATTGKVRYTPNTMSMNGYDKFAYAVNYTGTTNPGYYYDTVTVIPATIIYYEDSFMENGITYTGNWSVDGVEVTGATQAEDRPGAYSLTDANNIYGYDGTYATINTHSLGSAHKVTVTGDEYATATFTFCGTGFDIISLTSNQTGTILVDVTYTNPETKEATAVRNLIVDTYYGYTKDENGKWVISENAPNALYQVPVIKVSGLGYGTYTAVITVFYDSMFEHKANGTAYDFYLDAIRIYDPANNGKEDSDDVIKNAYLADGEAYPTYYELRNQIISTQTFDSLNEEDVAEGIIFIDNNNENTSIDDYENFGPNNELYLAPGQAVAAKLEATDAVKVHLGVKSVKEIGNVNVYAIGEDADNDGKDDIATANVKQVSTTDMYYDITALNNKTMIIHNTGNSIISITNIKVTYKVEQSQNDSGTDDEQEVEGGTTPHLLSVTRTTATLAVASLTAEEEPEVEEIPVFTPESFDVRVSSNSVKVGQKFSVIITTSADVESVSVNGQTVTKYKENRKAGVRTWSVQMTAAEAGDMTISVVAYDADGIASEAEETVVTVAEKNNKNNKKNKK